MFVVKVVDKSVVREHRAPDDEVAWTHIIGGDAVTVRPARAHAPEASPRTSEERRALDHSLSTLYDRLLAAQSAAELAAEDAIAAHLRSLRSVVHTRLVYLDWGRDD